jgi:hypothetical protein
MMTMTAGELIAELSTRDPSTWVYVRVTGDGHTPEGIHIEDGEDDQGAVCTGLCTGLAYEVDAVRVTHSGASLTIEATELWETP